MTKHIKLLFAILLMLTMILSPAGTTAFATGLPPITGDEIITDDYNELSIRNTVSSYFNQREAYLLGEVTTIANVNPGIELDEAAHLTAIVNSNIEWLGSDILINSAVCYESHAEAIVTEIVSFRDNDVDQTETIIHTMQLGQLDDGTILVVRDGYFENSTGFKSCSYVPVDNVPASVMTVFSEGCAACLVTVAQNELGYVEESGNVTKYGDTDGGGWCIAFIAWCANQADVSATTIPQTYSPYVMRNYFVESGRYYTRASGYTPEPGDIYFGSEDGTSTDHGGIVYAVDSNYVYTIDGNWSDMVKLKTIARTDTYIMGYGHPDYVASTHTYSICTYLNESTHRLECAHCNAVRTESHSYGYDSWFYDSTNHWRECACGKHGTESAHSLVSQSNSTQHWMKCSTCEMSTTPVTHKFIQDSVTGARKCRVCGAYENITMGIPQPIENAIQ